MAKNQELPALSETQLEIMNVIWEREECSVADVWKILNGRRGVTRNTVHTLIVRLEEKGWLTHSESTGGFLYKATITREKAQQRGVQKMVKTMFGGSAEGLVLTLLNGSTLSQAEADRIRKIIAKAKGRKS